MKFRVVDIQYNSKNAIFIFDNDATFKLQVTTKCGNLFEIARLYDIKVSHQLSIENTYIGLGPPGVFSNLGVVLKKTRNSVHIACGDTQWKFPKLVCDLNPGIDVWIKVELINEIKK
tara:strand:+ start:211 stop:561 length:351 start_codon:yes stop_codon:yes gene_type:complete